MGKGIKKLLCNLFSEEQVRETEEPIDAVNKRDTVVEREVIDYEQLGLCMKKAFSEAMKEDRESQTEVALGLQDPVTETMRVLYSVIWMIVGIVCFLLAAVVIGISIIEVIDKAWALAILTATWVGAILLNIGIVFNDQIRSFKYINIKYLTNFMAALIAFLGVAIFAIGIMNQSLVPLLIMGMLSLIMISASYVNVKHIEKEKDRHFLAASFSSFVSFTALIIAGISLVMTLSAGQVKGLELFEEGSIISVQQIETENAKDNAKDIVEYKVTVKREEVKENDASDGGVND